MKNTTIAIDLAKSVFEIGISDRPGHVARNHRLSRSELAPFVAAQPPATILMEACSSAHYWGRKFEGFGHDVKLLPPFAVRPYVQRSKTDRTPTSKACSRPGATARSGPFRSRRRVNSN
jgi:transposase